MSINSRKLVNLLFITIPIYFIIRNTELFASGFYSNIFKEIIYLSIFILLYIFSKGNNIYNKRLIFFNYSYLFYFLFIAIGTISLVPKLFIGEFSQLISLKYYLYDFIFYSLLVRILYNLQCIDQVVKLIVNISLFFAIGSIIQMIFYKVGIVSYDQLDRIYSIPVFESRVSFVVTNPNLLAFIITLSLLMTDLLKKNIVIDLIFLFVVFLTGSRIFSLVCLIIFSLRYLNNKRYIIITAILLIPLIIVLFLKLNVYERFVHTIQVFGNDPRFSIWNALLNNNFDWLTLFIGNGFGNIGNYFGIENSVNIPVYYNGLLYTSKINYIDNSFITIFNESGIIGLILFLTFIFYNLHITLKNKNKISFLSFKVQLIIILASFFGDVFFSYPALFFYIIFINTIYYEQDFSFS